MGPDYMSKWTEWVCGDMIIGQYKIVLSCDWLQNFCPGQSGRTMTTKKTEAGINSYITFPSKVRAQQDPTKKQVT